MVLVYARLLYVMANYSLFMALSGGIFQTVHELPRLQEVYMDIFEIKYTKIYQIYLGTVTPSYCESVF